MNHLNIQLTITNAQIGFNTITIYWHTIGRKSLYEQSAIYTQTVNTRSFVWHLSSEKKLEVAISVPRVKGNCCVYCLECTTLSLYDAYHQRKNMFSFMIQALISSLAFQLNLSLAADWHWYTFKHCIPNSMLYSYNVSIHSCNWITRIQCKTWI